VGDSGVSSHFVKLRAKWLTAWSTTCFIQGKIYPHITIIEKMLPIFFCDFRIPFGLMGAYFHQKWPFSPPP
jgi:hypothetical protein